jgi:hypothetical protein
MQTTSLAQSMVVLLDYATHRLRQSSSLVAMQAVKQLPLGRVLDLQRRANALAQRPRIPSSCGPSPRAGQSVLIGIHSSQRVIKGPAG